MICHRDVFFDVSLKVLETAFEISFVLRFFDETIKRAPIGSFCIVGVQYITGRYLSFDLLENSYVGLGVLFSPGSLRIFKTSCLSKPF